ncbi:MAG: nucleotidyl transferase AbiEii/AbiGii toxin family protein [Candidatus Diapherotrites archaeon]
MIPSDFTEKVAESLGIRETKLVEKDLYLQGLLIELSKSEYFSENFVFKGGTCLTKAYFGYYRFSEDLDFTWLRQEAFKGKTENQIRRMLSEEINKIMELLAVTAKELGLDFRAEKSDKHYVQLGGSNRFATFKFWYKPGNPVENETFIKIQLSFVDKIIHAPKKHKLAPLSPPGKKELELEYPEYAAMALESPSVYCYDLKEIASEKIRALLTRRGFKARDIVDLYMLDKKGITIKSARAMASEKTLFMLRYLKYAEHLKLRHFGGNFALGEEQNLLVKQQGKDFGKFAEKALAELDGLAEEIRRKSAKWRGREKGDVI